MYNPVPRGTADISKGAERTSTRREPNIVKSPAEVVVDNLYMDLSGEFCRPVHLKCEGLNLAGSVKIKAAREMLDSAMQKGRLVPGSRFVESSSGSLGVALAMLAAHNDLLFTCVTDTRCNPATIQLMRTYGAEVIIISTPHPQHGLLGARMDYIADLLEKDADLVWLNQYASKDNWGAHYATTGPRIVEDFPLVDFIFIGAGTTGTLTGTARYLKENGHPATIVAIDTVGSVTFRQPPAPRHIPGLGTGRRPEIVDESVVDELIMVSELDAIRMCRRFARSGLLFGGSTGSVLAGVQHRLSGEPLNAASLAICPDFGERYLDTVYNDEWVAERFDLAAASSAPLVVELGVN